MQEIPYKKGFIIISSLYLLLLLLDKEQWAWYGKPFLLPFLLLMTLKAPFFKTKKWLLLALLFSWIGDIVLMFTDKNELFFIFGLVSFLIAHLLFIVLFTKQEATVYHTQKNYYWLFYGIILLYLFGLLSILLPKLGDLKIPVGIYAMTISLMLIEALKGYFNWNNPRKTQVVIAAALFVLSDSILAINKFHTPLPLATLWIMSTYLMAQYFICTGIIQKPEKRG